MSSLTREQIEDMCELAIGVNRLWSREKAETLRDMALRALPAGEGVVVPIAEVQNLTSARMLIIGGAPVGTKLFAASPAPVAAEVEVRVGCMTESNGRETWIVQLYQPADSPIDALQVYASNVKGRAEYEAARFRHFFGQGPEPDLLAYDTDEPPVDKGTA